jgi:hypothetical protein
VSLQSPRKDQRYHKAKSFSPGMGSAHRSSICRVSSVAASGAVSMSRLMVGMLMKIV